jgi:N-acetylmuramoyl-L-alanine amidase
MKAAVILSLLLASASAQAAAMSPSAKPRATHVEISGRNYARLNEWARVNNFSVQWSKAGDEIQLSNHLTRLLFRKDSREAQVNGIGVCLSYPMLVRDGSGCIAQVDLETAVAPVLYPSKNLRPGAVKNIVIDPGHGGKDPGNQVGSHQEKKYTLLLAEEVAKQLNRAGFKASLTRTTDTFIDLPVRPDIARRRGADLFISLHWNELPGNSSVSGAQTFCMTPVGASSSNAGGEVIGASRKVGNRNDEKNMLLAYELQHSLIQHLNVEDRGVRRARFEVLRDAEMPAVLIEGGFMSNPSDARRIYDANFRTQMAQAIVAGVMAYKDKVEQPQPVKRPQTSH